MAATHAWRAQPIPTAVGIGLRPAHLAHVLAHRPPVPFFELHSENFFCAGGALWDAFEALRRDYPVSLHGVGLALGSTAPLDPGHLAALRALVDRVEPALVSEHVCWGRLGERHFNDLLPLPCTEEALSLMVSRVRQLQDALGRRVLLENVSSYVRFTHSTLGEGEFLAALARESGCGLLLDINNVYVNAVNHGEDPRRTFAALDPATIGELHLAGFTRKEGLGGPLLIDSHDARVDPAVWALYAEAVARFGARPTLIEWDQHLPEFGVLEDEARLAGEILDADATLPA
ncbi:MAG TPA: DUF692 domain-containing protein [Frateuria sp.]|uniref:MNIO family bufferin maturase n=1 Tax=Frateuria sp. TaxID=2211372 RepID=UPI002D7FCF43|nr:DUF692 domain-containing protein [Frateuria sp.]HET6806186.1 DUF692 domain-containing protein [Frateuria sp.]